MRYRNPLVGIVVSGGSGLLVAVVSWSGRSRHAFGATPRAGGSSLGELPQAAPPVCLTNQAPSQIPFEQARRQIYSALWRGLGFSPGRPVLRRNADSCIGVEAPGHGRWCRLRPAKAGGPLLVVVVPGSLGSESAQRCGGRRLCRLQSGTRWRGATGSGQKQSVNRRGTGSGPGRSAPQRFHRSRGPLGS